MARTRNHEAIERARVLWGAAEAEEAQVGEVSASPKVARRMLVLLISSFVVPLVALVLLWASEGTDAFVRWVMVGVTFLSIMAAWVTSGMPSDEVRRGVDDDDGASRDRT